MMKVMVMVMVLMLLMLVLRMLYIVKQKQLNSFLLRVKKLSWEDELAAYNGGQVSQHFEQPKTSSISTSLPKLCPPPLYRHPGGLGLIHRHQHPPIAHIFHNNLLFQDREISTYLDPNVSVTPMAESHRSMGDTVYF